MQRRPGGHVLGRPRRERSNLRHAVGCSNCPRSRLRHATAPPTAPKWGTRTGRAGDPLLTVSVIRATTARPRPGHVAMSKAWDWRLTAPRPVPGVPPVECPSRSAPATSEIPAPRSSAKISTPVPVSSSKVPSKISPLVPYLTRLVASSVATMATRPPDVSSKPSVRATPVARRLASATWLASNTGTLIMLTSSARW